MHTLAEPPVHHSVFLLCARISLCAPLQLTKPLVARWYSSRGAHHHHGSNGSSNTAHSTGSGGTSSSSSGSGSAYSLLHELGRHADWRLALAPGGMPSSHTAAVVSTAVSVGLRAGTSSAVFAIAVVFAVVTAYDATGVRFHAGKHASVLNQLVAELPDSHPAADQAQLHEVLGHERDEVVAGAALGLVVAVLVSVVAG